MPADDEIPDNTLLDRFVRHGDESAFAALVRRHHGMAFATALRICGDRAEAQDVLQQALIVLARRAGELGDVRSLGAWLHRVVVLEAGKSRQKTHKRRLRETMAYQIDAMAREAEEAAAKILPELDRSLDALPAKDREVLTLHYLQGHTFKSIQQLLGGTAEGWQKRSVRALEKLSARLRGRGVTVSAVTLGAVLAGSRAEAGVTSTFLESATRRALDQGLVKTTGLSAKLALLLTMKTGIAISLTSGVILAYGWSATARSLRAPHDEPGASAR
ncbi:MAG: sigma-70 family RNA polymerase sigma factor, partial [Verrucomicrobiaceae bacterium]